MSPATGHPLQPLLDDAVIALRAPTQVWGGRSGDLGGSAIDGVYHGDVRHLRALRATCEGTTLETISVAPDGPSRVVFGSVLRGLDDPSPDPGVRMLHERVVAEGRVSERWVVRSRAPHVVETRLRVELEPEFAPLPEVKAGRPAARVFLLEPGEARAVVTEGPRTLVVTAPGAAVAAGRRSGDDRGADVAPAAGTGADDAVALDAGTVVVTWDLRIEPGSEAEVGLELALSDETLVVRGVTEPAGWDAAAVASSTDDPRLRRWLRTALGDLDALRMALPEHPSDEFFAAGAPWFFTLFGRDSLWAARLALPLDPGIAASTLRVLARLAGTRHDAATAQEPGKIPHELRASTLEIPGEGIVLPPLYYGSVDATPLWVCLLADACRAGMPDDEVRALVPALRDALTWMLEEGDSDGDGFLDYVDRTGHGLANQGWKDSGDSIQWRDGRLADGPIALCEVQAYAYEAAHAGADLLERFDDEPGALTPSRLRGWAADLRARFATAYWVVTPEGRYPAVALDRDKRPVDTLTSNIGHLVGTGILDPEDEARIAGLLLAPSMSSGYGIRTMSTGAAGYWPLSYHGGSVWTHDTAIAAHGMLRAGLLPEARAVAAGMLDAAEGFGYRVPELHSGDPRSETAVPTPYPAACRPQAWSAAAAVVCLQVRREP